MHIIIVCNSMNLWSHWSKVQVVLRISSLSVMYLVHVPVGRCSFLRRCTELDWLCLLMWNGFSGTSIMLSSVFGEVSTRFWTGGRVGVASDNSVPSNSSSEATCIPNILLSKEVDLVFSVSNGRRDIGELPSESNGRVFLRSWNWSSHFWLSSMVLSSKKSCSSFMNLGKCINVCGSICEAVTIRLNLHGALHGHSTLHNNHIILFLFDAWEWQYIHVLSYLYVKLLESGMLHISTKWNMHSQCTSYCGTLKQWP